MRTEESFVQVDFFPCRHTEEVFNFSNDHTAAISQVRMAQQKSYWVQLHDVEMSKKEPDQIDDMTSAFWCRMVM